MTEAPSPDDAPLRRLQLEPLHAEHGAKFGAFAGYHMPLQYGEGALAEHVWTRRAAGLFDVSHMGPCFVRLPPGRDSDAAHEAIAALIEPLVAADLRDLAPGQQALTVLLNEAGGVIDDLIIARPREPHEQGGLYVVVNGAVKERDFALLSDAAAKGGAEFARADDRILLALQGPRAREALVRLAPEAAATFMTTARAELFGARCFVSCCGYTGEDGFEILAPAAVGEALARALLDMPEVKPIGLAARDSLRLEAGLCLYGHELNEEISPIEAGLAFTIGKRRRAAADFPGAPRILRELREGPARRRVGVLPLERAPAREGVAIQQDGEALGVITSGGYSPILEAPISMGYVRADAAKPGAQVELIIRGKARAGAIAPLPFVPHRALRRQA